MRAIGTVVLGGMITGVILVVLFVPLFYVIIEKTFGRRRSAARAAQNQEPTT
jgi:Cu/Ag efflux pump CusA